MQIYPPKLRSQWTARGRPTAAPCGRDGRARSLRCQVSLRLRDRRLAADLHGRAFRDS